MATWDEHVGSSDCRQQSEARKRHKHGAKALKKKSSSELENEGQTTTVSSSETASSVKVTGKEVRCRRLSRDQEIQKSKSRDQEIQKEGLDERGRSKRAQKHDKRHPENHGRDNGGGSSKHQRVGNCPGESRLSPKENVSSNTNSPGRKHGCCDDGAIATRVCNKTRDEGQHKTRSRNQIVKRDGGAPGYQPSDISTSTSSQATPSHEFLEGSAEDMYQPWLATAQVNPSPYHVDFDHSMTTGTVPLESPVVVVPPPPPVSAVTGVVAPASDFTTVFSTDRLACWLIDHNPGVAIRYVETTMI